jgi:D-threo-aldose 1-dehydrogenase
MEHRIAMQTITLGSTGRITTRLGFGCSSIMGAINKRQSLSLLESAFDAGIRHFDIAPMYGYGKAESCLGEFLNRHRGAVTVTTKFGIPPRRHKILIRTARALVGPMVQSFPGLKKRLRGATQAKSQPKVETPKSPNPIFTAERARASLNASLTALKTERIDVWLLHEVNAMDLAADSQNDPLLRLLEDTVREGKVGMFGVGSDREAIPELLSKHPGYCQVAQHEWSVLNPSIPETAYFRIHHRALSEHFHTLVDLLKTQPERCRQWSEEVGEDLANSETLAHLMLKASCILNSSSVILFSSRRSSHIRANVTIADNAALDVPARRLYELFQREQPSLA